MRERVEPRRGRQPFRHAEHKHGVVDGDERGAAGVDDGHLDVAGGVGDDGEAGHLGGGSGGGVDLLFFDCFGFVFIFVTKKGQRRRQ